MLSQQLGWLPPADMHSDIAEMWCKGVGDFLILVLHGANKIKFPNKIVYF